MSVQYNFQNVIDNQGISIAITGMLIVFVALCLISLFISILPRIVSALNNRFPEPAEAATVSSSTDPAIVAAIGLALHRRSQATGGRRT